MDRCILRRRGTLPIDRRFKQALAEEAILYYFDQVFVPGPAWYIEQNTYVVTVPLSEGDKSVIEQIGVT
jgi:hypothetical protein